MLPAPDHSGAGFSLMRPAFFLAVCVGFKGMAQGLPP
jgi:hypothetical protein